MSKARRINMWLLVIVALVFAAFYWLLRDNRTGDAPARPLALAELRALAASLPGQGPTRIEVELVGARQTPGDMIAGGSGLSPVLIGALAYRLELPGRGPILIDSGFPPEAAQDLGLDAYYGRSQERIEAALKQASLVLLTSERSDHAAGLRSLLDSSPERLPAALGPSQYRQNFPATPRAPAPPVGRPRPAAVAPGIVVIPTPEIGAGAQMIFVRLDDGREYLFTGDAAMLDINWRELRAPPRLAELTGAAPQRRAVYSWLRTIRALKQAAPAMLVIPGHDLTFLRNPEHARPRLKFGFTPEAAVSRRDADATT